MAIEQELNKTNPLHKEFQDLLDQDFKNRKVKEGEIIKATVTEILKNHVVCDLKSKQEAMINIDEFKTNGELEKLKVNSEVSVFVERLENKFGEIVVSREKARRLVAWKRILKLHETQEEAVGYLKGRVKGGMVCEIDGCPTFMPSSQISDAPLKKIDHLMNTPIRVMITRIDAKRINACSSRRAVLEKSKNAKLKEALKNMKEGDIVENATVKAIPEGKWGAFLDLGNNCLALLHQSDISHNRISSVTDILSVGQKIPKVVISKIDKETNRISASIKLLSESPFENIESKFKIGETYPGEVVKLSEFGAFVLITNSDNVSAEGLVHQSMLDFADKNVKPSKILSVSQKISVKVVSIDVNAKRIGLSYKDREGAENPWNKIKDKVGKVVEVKVKNITEKAIFCELLDTKLTGKLFYKDISYEENIEDLKKFKKNDLIKVKIVSVTDDKVQLSKRAIEKDPLDWFKDNNKKEGDIITTRIHEVLKSGVKVSIDKEKKLIVTIRKADLAKEAADSRPEIYSQDNKIDAKLIELDLKNRRIKLSPKAALIQEEQSLIKKFGAGATKSGATLKEIFSKAIGKKNKKDK